MKKINIGLLGMGNIGTGTYKLLEQNRTTIENACGCSIEIVKILVSNINKQRDIEVPSWKFTDNPDDIIKSKDIHIVVELIGGVEPASDFMLQAMAQGKHVVTANKAAVAKNFKLFTKCAEENNVKLLYEASVGGGIPVLSAIRTSLLANTFTNVMGILNGTTNFILTQMCDEGLTYDDALKIAQEKGFAEADPTADVEGIDAANKLTILMKLLFDKHILPESIPTTGITSISAEDVKKAKESGSRIKLIARASASEGNLQYKVEPMILPNEHPLAGVSNEFNGIYITGDAVGELMFYGKGAGPMPTASAVVGDIIQIINMEER